MKKFLIVIAMLLLAVTSQADLFDKLIKTLQDCKEVKEIIIKDGMELKQYYDSLITYFNDSIIIYKKDTIK